jgi:hypothetical protein
MLQRSILAILLHVERERRKASSAHEGYQAPLMAEWVSEPGVAPLYSSNLQGGLLPAKVHQDTGVLRLGFFRCSLEQEGKWLAYLAQVLSRAAEVNRWPIAHTTPIQAIQAMASRGCPASHWVAPPNLVQEASGLSTEEAQTLMGVQGYVSEVEGVRLVMADLDPDSQLLVSAPSLAGLYIRSDDHMAVSIWRASTAWGVVRAG